MATTSHAAGLELLGDASLGDSDWEGFERYRLLATVLPHRYPVAGRNVALLPSMLLQTLAKRVQPLVEPISIVPEHPVPHVGY
jgi:hypothetical protein